MSKVALIIIYNHCYTNNIPTLESIYNKKFDDVFHLIPFYQGNDHNVIPVYGNSHYFQGYIAQGYKYFKNTSYNHYLFISDDLILNPKINADNYNDILKIDAASSFLPGFIKLHEVDSRWHGGKHAYCFSKNKPGLEVQGMLPDHISAIKKFKTHSIDIKPLTFNQIWNKPESLGDIMHIINHDKLYPIRQVLSKLTGIKYKLPYPLIGGYSDICAVSGETIKQFCHYCGIFSALDLFVEIALPSAMALSAKRIVTEKDIALAGRALWTEDDLNFLDIYNYNIDTLLANFPSDYLYLHPVKLSKWGTRCPNSL